MLSDLFDHLSGGNAHRLQQQQTDAEFNALIERNNAFARMIGVPEQELPKSLDQARLETQILPALRNQAAGGQATQLSNGQNVLSLLSQFPQAQPVQAATPSLFNSWQGYTQRAGQSAPQAEAVPPAQMNLGQVQPQAASRSATGSTAYPGQRYQPQSLGGLGGQQQSFGQQQGQQGGQQGFGIGGGHSRRRGGQGLGMLASSLIA